jgi:hypothetical protein
MNRLLITAASFAAIFMLACGPAGPGEGEGEGEGEGLEPTFTNVKSEIFEEVCAGCHVSGATAPRGLTLNASTTVDDLVGKEATDMGETLVVAGDAANSLLYKLLGEGVGSAAQMPKGGSAVSEANMTLLMDWIDAGALDD